jgi:hypothetical protein
VSPRAQVAVLVVAAVLAGAGVGALIATVTRDNTTTVTTASEATSSSATGAAPSHPRNPPVDEAVGEVEAKGYVVEDTGSYDPDSRLAVLIGVEHGSADGTAQKAFFFADGRFVGTDTADVSADIAIASASDDEVGLRYALYKPGNRQCCPHGGTAVVSYRWDGSSLKPLQPIPPSSEKAALSRR